MGVWHGAHTEQEKLGMCLRGEKPCDTFIGDSKGTLNKGGKEPWRSLCYRRRRFKKALLVNLRKWGPGNDSFRKMLALQEGDSEFDSQNPH